jgi:hypothetical protein
LVGQFTLEYKTKNKNFSILLLTRKPEEVKIKRKMRVFKR